MSDFAIGIVDREYQTGGAVDTNPSPAQKEAGNFKKKHIVFQGIPISIENPKGSIRHGTDDNGKPWANRMPADYGYIKRTEDKDGDQIDVFVGPNKNSDRVFIVDQVHRHSGQFDEHKCLLGFSTEAQALNAYHRSHGYGSRQRIGGITELPISEFREWAKRGGGKWPLSPLVGAYILPHDVPKLLGNGNEQTGHAVAAKMFGQHAALGESAVHPEVVKELGNGDLAAGHAVLEKFVAMVRSKGDEYHGGVKVTKAEAHYRNGTEAQRCAICSMFRAPDACTAVKGKISPQALCDYFERKS